MSDFYSLIPIEKYSESYFGSRLTGNQDVDRKSIDYELQCNCFNRSISLYIDLLDLLNKYFVVDGFVGDGAGRDVRILNIGWNNSAGAELMANIYNGPWSGCSVISDVVDVDDAHFEYVRALYPKVSRFQTFDEIVDLGVTYDYIITAFEIQNSEDFVGYINSMRRLAKRRVFCIAPYSENGAIGIDDLALRSFFSEDVVIKENWHWALASNGSRVVAFTTFGEAL